MSKELPHPEIDKMKAVQAESQSIGAFIDWLQQNEMAICIHEDVGEYRTKMEYWPIRKNIEQILAEYFEIDLNKVEKEKVAILEDFRKRTGVS